MASDPAAEAWALLSQVFMANRAHFLRVGQQLDLHPMQFHALRLLEPGAAKSMRELADSLICDASNVTGIVDRLEERGLIERRAVAHDRRVKLLALTPAGEDLREQALSRMAEPPDQVRALPLEDQRALRDALQRVVAQLEETKPVGAGG